MDSIEGVWFRNPKTGFVHKVVHPETIARCRAEGHIEVPDPTLPVAVDAPPDAPLDVPTGDDEAALVAIQERNDAARMAFSIEPSAPRQAAKPVKRVQPRQPSDTTGKGA